MFQELAKRRANLQVSKALGKPGRKGDDETFPWASCNGENHAEDHQALKKRLAPCVSWSSRDAEHLGGPAKGHVTALGLPAAERECFDTTWPRDLTVSSLVLHVRKA